MQMIVGAGVCGWYGPAQRGNMLNTTLKRASLGMQKGCLMRLPTLLPASRVDALTPSRPPEHTHARTHIPPPPPAPRAPCSRRQVLVEKFNIMPASLDAPEEDLKKMMANK